MPSSHSARRENAGRSLSPRFSLRCKTIARSLIFAPRRRLPPPLLSARQFSLKTHGITVGFLHLCLPLTLRVAKMQDVHSLLVFRSATKLSLVLSFLLRGGGFRRFFKAILAQNPRHRRGFLAFMPSSHSTRRENARRSLSPRFSLRCKTIARSLIFAPRRRLPPLFQGNFRSKPAASTRVSCTYAFLSLYASRKYYFASRGECCYPRLPYGLSSPVSLPHRKYFRRGPRN